MFSVFDLMDAGTLDLELAAFLMARMTMNKSCMVGAVPGGAGKTTVMCALVNLVAADVSLVAATPKTLRSAAIDRPSSSLCYICHEIGSGPYYAYLWGRDLRDFCSLSTKGYILATNLHADDIDEARDQVCGENQVEEKLFNAFEILVFLRVRRGFGQTHRVIEKVYVSDGSNIHTLVFDRNQGLMSAESPDRDSISTEWETACKDFLISETERGTRTIEQTRVRLVKFLTERN